MFQVFNVCKRLNASVPSGAVSQDLFSDDPGQPATQLEDGPPSPSILPQEQDRSHFYSELLVAHEKRNPESMVMTTQEMHNIPKQIPQYLIDILNQTQKRKPTSPAKSQKEPKHPKQRGEEVIAGNMSFSLPLATSTQKEKEDEITAAEALAALEAIQEESDTEQLWLSTTSRPPGHPPGPPANQQESHKKDLLFATNLPAANQQESHREDLLVAKGDEVLVELTVANPDLQVHVPQAAKEEPVKDELPTGTPSQDVQQDSSLSSESSSNLSKSRWKLQEQAAGRILRTKEIEKEVSDLLRQKQALKDSLRAKECTDRETLSVLADIEDVNDKLTVCNMKKLDIVSEAVSDLRLEARNSRADYRLHPVLTAIRNAVDSNQSSLQQLGNKLGMEVGAHPQSDEGLAELDEAQRDLVKEFTSRIPCKTVEKIEELFRGKKRVMAYTKALVRSLPADPKSVFQHAVVPVVSEELLSVAAFPVNRQVF
jgi:hypothetical protein